MSPDSCLPSHSDFEVHRVNMRPIGPAIVMFLFVVLRLVHNVESLITQYQGLPKMRKYISKTIDDSAASKEACLEKKCKTKDHCVVIWNTRNNRECRAVGFPALIILWNSKAALTANSDYKTLVMTKSSVKQIPSPAIMWIYDDLSEGRNFGSKGGTLDITVKGLRWAPGGPHKSSRRYAHNNGKNAILNYVKLLQNGKWLFKFSAGFTISMWVKTERNGAHAIIENKSTRLPDSDIGMDFWFWPKHNTTIHLSICHDGRYLLVQRLEVSQTPQT